MLSYVCGFAVDLLMKKVVLIQKDHPEWQKGKWNGLGGVISPDHYYSAKKEAIEYPHDAMVRKFEEETLGMRVTRNRWLCFHIEEFQQGQERTTVYYFVALIPDQKEFLTIRRSDTSHEPVRVWDFDDILWEDPQLVYNVKNLLDMIRIHAKWGSLLNLDPQFINSRCPR